MQVAYGRRIAEDAIAALNPFLYIKDKEYYNSGDTLAEDGQTVERWGDRSGASRDAVQATESLKPVREDSSNTIVFDGTDDVMSFGDIGNSVFTDDQFSIVWRGYRNTEGTIIQKGLAGGTFQLRFAMNPGRLTLTLSSNGSAATLFLRAAKTFNIGTVYTVALIVDKSLTGIADQFKFKADAATLETLVDINTSTGVFASSAPLVAGNDESGAIPFGSGWKGMCIFPYALTEEQYTTCHNILSAI